MEIKNCPFCGSHYMVIKSFPLGKDTGWKVMCGSCEAIGPWRGSADEAQESWNERVEYWR